jgi:hypothetical protein
MAKTKKAAERARQARARAGALRAVLKSTMRRTALESTIAFEAAGESQVVTFACSNPACLVGITSGRLNFAFSGSGAASFPIGRSAVTFRVQGPRRTVTVSAAGGTLDPPIAGVPPFGGFTTLTVV